jgi:hypothetical protein
VCAASSWPQSGSYEVTAGLELPHLDRWSLDKTTIFCLRDSPSSKTVLSANNLFAKCAAGNLVIDGPKLEYDIGCPECGAAKGHAVYMFSAGIFSGRVAMVMGAKNMTMTEIQHGRRIGECSPRQSKSPPSLLNLASIFVAVRGWGHGIRDPQRRCAA